MVPRILVGLGGVLMVIGAGLFYVPLAFLLAGVLIFILGLLFLDF